MPQGNQILRTTTEDVQRLNKLVISSSTRNLRVLKGQVERRIIIFERRLVELYNNEALVKARIYNNADAITIAEKYSAGLNTQVKPVQAFQEQNVDPDPHRSYAYNKYTIYATKKAISVLDTELNRINNEIQIIQANVREYNTTLIDINAKLAEAEEKEKTNLFDKTIGRVLPPTPADLEKDKIARARISNIFLLQRLAVMYRDYTVDSDGVTKYPDEKSLPKDLQILRQLFWAHGQSDNLVYDAVSYTWTTPLRDSLNFDNPGDAGNITIMDEVVAAERTTGRNTKTDIQVDRFVRDVLATANDPIISRGIERKSDIGLAEENSVREQTKSYPAAMIRLGNFYIGSFELPSMTQSLRKWWKKRNESLYKGLPTCPNVDHSQLATSTDTKESTNDAVNAATRAAGEVKYREALQKAQGLIGTEVQDRVGDLPSDADEWVKIYASIFSDSRRGTFRYEGSQMVVTRAEDPDRDISAQVARGLAPSGGLEADDYAYFSVTGYNVTYVDGQTGFIPIAEWENFKNGLDADGNSLGFDTSQVVSSSSGNWVTYILWA